MKTIINIIVILSFLIASSCSERLEEINLDPNRLEAEEAVPGPLFAKSITIALHKENFSQLLELIADFGPMAHYFATLYPTAFAADSYYDLRQWSDFGYWNIYWKSVGLVNDVLRLTEPGGEYENGNNHAMARIWKVYLMHKLSDAYGDIPYLESGYAGDGIINPVYSSQEEVYRDFFEQLDKALLDLETEVPGVFTTQDIIYTGNIDGWRKFASSLKLRLALRLRYVDPDFAKMKTEEALQSGIISSNEENAQEISGDNWGNFGSQIYQITANLFAYGQSFKASASLVEYLKGNHLYRDGSAPSGQDPRLGILIDKNPSGEYVGIENGHTAEYYDLHPEFQTDGSWFLFHNNQYEPVTVMSYAETLFLESEAALLGYEGTRGGAAELYRAGIEASMEYLGVDGSSFAADEEALFSALVDDEAKLERIIYQKWIALFPDSHEAWVEQRRTGYPVVIKRSGDNYEQGITGGTIPNRIPYPEGEWNTNYTHVSAARENQGGDAMLDKIWWDKKTLQDSWE
jgi:hypothetical protein